ncbi:hypothetical protein CCR96_00990 [Halochromatium roseum]|nr:hypothetical protein [Halochromatium roseum]
MATQHWTTFGPSSGAPIAGFRKPTQAGDALVIRNDGRCEPRYWSIDHKLLISVAPDGSLRQLS